MLALAFAPVALAFGVLDLPGATASTLLLRPRRRGGRPRLFTLPRRRRRRPPSPRPRCCSRCPHSSAVVHAGLGLMPHRPPRCSGCSPWPSSPAPPAPSSSQPAMTGIVPQVVPAAGLQGGQCPLIGLGGNLARIPRPRRRRHRRRRDRRRLGPHRRRRDLRRLRPPRRSSASRPRPTRTTGLHRWPNSARAGSSFAREVGYGRAWCSSRSLVMVWQAAHLVPARSSRCATSRRAGTWTTVLTVDPSVSSSAGSPPCAGSPSGRSSPWSCSASWPLRPIPPRRPCAPAPLVLAGSFGLGFAFQLLTVIWQTTMQREIPPSRCRGSVHIRTGPPARPGLVLAGPRPITWCARRSSRAAWS